MFERFTERSRRVVVLAQEESRRLSHNYIGTEHLLLGLIREEEGWAYKALESLGVTLDKARGQVEAILGRGESSPSGHIPFTPRAKRVLAFSLRESLLLSVNYIGTEHILLGLVREEVRSETDPPVIAHVVLANLGVDLKALRQAVLDLLPEPTPAKRPSRAKPAQTPRGASYERAISTAEKLVVLSQELVVNIMKLSEAFNDELMAKDQIIAKCEAKIADLERRLAELTEPDDTSE